MTVTPTSGTYRIPITTASITINAPSNKNVYVFPPTADYTIQGEPSVTILAGGSATFTLVNYNYARVLGATTEEGTDTTQTEVVTAQITDFNQAVMNAPLQGLTNEVAATLSPADTIRKAFGKINAYITGAVTSVFGRTGAVTAQAGDYTADKITNVPAGTIAATDVQAAINELDADIQAIPAPPVTSVFGRIGAILAVLGDYTASLISFTPYKTIAATTVQAAIQEVADWSDAAATWQFYTDWEGAGINGATLTSDKLALDIVGAGAGASPISALTNTVGVFGVTTGTTATGGAYLGSGPNCLLLGGGAVMVEHRIYHPVLSDGTQTFTTRVGIVNQMGGDGTNGVYFRYTNGVNGGRFQCVCRSGGSEAGSVVDSGITVAATTWYKLRIEVNTAATSVAFYIDNVLVATITTNIPTAAIGLATQITKTVGTTARLIYVDWSRAVKVMAR